MKEVLNKYQKFVTKVLKRYRIEIIRLSDVPNGETYFEMFWKLFFDELISELNRVCLLHRDDFENWAEVRNNLQTIAEEGLNDFADFAKKRYNFVRVISQV